MEQEEYQFGKTLESMKTLRELGVSTQPEPGYAKYPQAISLKNGKLQGEGAPIAAWRWFSLPLEEQSVLTELIGNYARPRVVIHAPLENNQWGTISCTVKAVTSAGPVFSIEFIMCYPIENR